MIRKVLTSLLVLCLLATSTFAQSDEGGRGSDISFQGCTSDTTDQTAYTYTAHAVGPTGDLRKTVIGVVAEDATSIFNLNTITVGGDSADVAIDNRGNAVAPMGTFWAALDNPAGTSENIVLTFSEAIQGATICVWAIYNLDFLVPVGTGNNSDGAGAATVLDHNATGNALYTNMSFAVSGSGGFTLTPGEGLTGSESADTSTAEWQYAAFTGRVGARRGLTQFTSDVGDAVASITSGVFWQSGTQDTRMYQIACFGDDVAATTYTETNIPTGVPHATRKTVAGIIVEDAATNFSFSSGTIGGDASTELVETGTVGLTEAAIYFLDSNSAGDHETIAITMSEATTAMMMCVYGIYNLNSNTATGSVANASNAAASMSGDVTCTGGGVAAAVTGADTTAITATWAGQSTLSITGFSSANMSVAMAQRWAAPGGTYDLDVDWTGTTADTSIASGCWR